MPVALAEIRAHLLPGLWALTNETTFANSPGFVLPALQASAPAIPALPVLGPGALAIVGAAAVVIRNPTVSRRGIFGLGALGNQRN